MEKLSDYFFHIIQISDGIGPDDIEKEISTNPNNEYFVISKGFHFMSLKRFFKWENCRMVFSSDDGFKKESRINFIGYFPKERAKDIFFISSTFPEAEMQSYLKQNTILQVWNQGDLAITEFDIITLSNNFPQQLRIVARGFDNLWIEAFLQNPVNLIFRKGDGTSPTDAEILEFAKTGKEKALIISQGFTAAQITAFKDAGAKILQWE